MRGTHDASSSPYSGHDGGVAGGGQRATADDAGDWVRPQFVARLNSRVLVTAFRDGLRETPGW